MKLVSIIITFNILFTFNNHRITHAAVNIPEQFVASPTSANATTQSPSTDQHPTTTPKPKIIIINSELCKKCSCDKINLLIDCSNKSITTTFSEEEWQILQNGDIVFNTIKLDHNEISHIPILPEYPVKSLYLNFNKINNISIGAFKNLADLTLLNLSNNKLTSKSLGPGVFEGKYATDKYEPLPKLKTLDLMYNEMHTLHVDLFEHLPNLEELFLGRNTFTVIDSSTTIAIASLNALRTLDMSYMELTALPETIFHTPIELETLILTGNLFHALPAALTHAKHLKKLILDENPLGDFDNNNAFRSLGELKYLSLSYLPHVTIIGPWALSDLQSLNTFIAINNPHLEHIDELAFARNTTNPNVYDYPPLEKLLLHNNKLTKIEHNLIIRWDKVSEIDLRFNPWKCDCTNSWFIHSLMQQIRNNTPRLTNDVVCATPPAWKTRPLLELSANTDQLSCETGSHSENASLILIGIVVGVLIGIPLTFGALLIYRKGCFGLLNRQIANAKRSLYNRASVSDEFNM